MDGHAVERRGTRSRMARYLDAESKLWQHYGLAARERFIDIDRPHARLRVLESGSGSPVLLIHGTVGPGSWPSLAARIPSRRALILDRPGWGRSTQVEFPRAGYRAFVADLLARTLDRLGIERIDVVGGSIGDLWALSLAEHRPDRVRRVVLLGAGPLVPAVRVPKFVKLVASPIGALIVRLPVGAERVRSILRDSGHGASLDAGRIPDAFVAWRAANDTWTDAMRGERAMIRRVVDHQRFRAGIPYDDDALRTVAAPVLLVYGTADPTGDVAIWRRFTELLPDGTLDVIEGAGHMPWFDEPVRVAAVVERFLASPALDDATGRSG